MRPILVAGAGNIGTLIALFLADSNDYDVYLADLNVDHLQQKSSFPKVTTLQLDVTDENALKHFVTHHSIEAIIASLPYYHKLPVARFARAENLFYFDLTEDNHVAEEIALLAQGATTAFVPRCGLAPGFINIVASDLIKQFDSVDNVALRAGCLPQSSHNALQYALTWSIDGLINEYGNLCYGLIEGKKNLLKPLEDLETVEIDGMLYEAFNTSGGVGSLVESYENKVKTLNYKTLRYPGHCEKMHFLMIDLNLNADRLTLKRLLENYLPKTQQDVVIVYVSIIGKIKGEYSEKQYSQKIYPHRFFDEIWSAIQVSTALGVCTVADIVLNQPQTFRGLVLQEQIDYSSFISNRFGKIMRSLNATNL